MPIDDHAVETLMMIDDLQALSKTWDEVNGDEDFPQARLNALNRTGAISAFAAMDPASTGTLLTALRLIGRADLSLGRVFEGHVNATQLVHVYGNDAQRARLSRDLTAGRCYGVWNTEPVPGMSIERMGSTWRLTGSKSFATGAGHIDLALITAKTSDGTKQLVLVDVAGKPDRIDNDGWAVRGMRGTMSGTFDFDGLAVDDAMLIGKGGDYEREPRFSAGAWRFTAVQLGAVEALLRHWRIHLVETGKDKDAIQRARFAECVVATRSAVQWVTRAAALAEGMHRDAVAHVLMTRGVVEEAGLQVMEGAARAVGTGSFFAHSRIDRITRDLGLYLRQPVPDQARNRAAEAWLSADRWGDDPWW